MRILVVFLLVCSTSLSLHAQSKATAELFPTYQQIKPAYSEIIDFVPKQGRSITVKLFDYPEKKVTYILNGKPTTNARYAKKVVTKKNTQIERINIHAPADDGKWVIEIEHSTNPKPNK